MPAAATNPAPLPASRGWACLAAGLWFLLAAGVAAGAATPTQPADLALRYAAEVNRRLALPAAEQEAYADSIRAALDAALLRITRDQLLVLVDRSAQVQAVMVWWAGTDGRLQLIGASPASTGQPGRFEHFATPTGVFEHSLAHPDFRAEGTRNALGIRGYGVKGMRVYDFGWVLAARGWSEGQQPMRLQMHATDPQHLEQRLGERASKGCIRIPATLNTFLDRHGVLDADYDQALAEGRTLWVLREDRVPSPWPGRYLVVVDSNRSERPAWSPAPGAAPKTAEITNAVGRC